jgi:hypothetical protein
MISNKHVRRIPVALFESHKLFGLGFWSGNLLITGIRCLVSWLDERTAGLDSRKRNLMLSFQRKTISYPWDYNYLCKRIIMLILGSSLHAPSV